MYKLKKMTEKIIIILAIICFTVINSSFSQELNCNVNVITPRIQETDKHLYDNMRQNILEFQKGHKWTEDEFMAIEKIECNFYITIEERVTTDRFRAKIQLTSVRPVFGTSYNTTLFNHLDNVFTFGMSVFETLYLGVRLWDINAQPNIFHRSFYESWQTPPHDFSLDLFAYYMAKQKRLDLVRFPVRFRSFPGFDHKE